MPLTSRPIVRLSRVLALLSAALLAAHGAARATDVTTYHYDNFRTGWNNAETILTPANVGPASFGLQHTVNLDEQVDAQPLLVSGLSLPGLGWHNVVYVATEANSLYAIDADTGATLMRRNFGPPVSFLTTPAACNNNSVSIGINSTPVIDPASGTLYVMTSIAGAAGPAYVLHAVNIATFADMVAPVTVAAAHASPVGGMLTFNAAYQRQRAALLLANGRVYAGFGSFCDVAADRSRGWLLGWQADTLRPLPANEVPNLLSAAPNLFFLSSVWMSGSGPAADEQGNVYVVTGNSDPSGQTYDPAANLSESVIEVAPDLSRVLDFFSPAGGRYDAHILDVNDLDFGSGGVMLIPAWYVRGKTAPTHPLAVATGKAGRTYLLNRGKGIDGGAGLGGYVPGGPNLSFAEVNTGGCWCAPAFFSGGTANGGTGKLDDIVVLVTGGGIGGKVAQVKETVYLLDLPGTAAPGPAPPGLVVPAAQSVNVVSGQDSGLFVTVSSGPPSINNAIIWAVSRPVGRYPNDAVTLYAIRAVAPTTLANPVLGAWPAGAWPCYDGNANITPVVANGHVFVASFRQLAIFGPTTAPAAPVDQGRCGWSGSIPVPSITIDAQVTGTVLAIDAATVQLATRTGAVALVDVSAAAQDHLSAPVVLGTAMTARGARGAGGVLHAASMVRAKPSPAQWAPDE